MPSFIHSVKFDGHSSHVRDYAEFDVDRDGPTLAAAMLKAYGTRAACLEEMPYMTIVAAAKDDRTTINGLACVRAYWRKLDAASAKEPGK